MAGAVATLKVASSIMDRVSAGPSTQKFHVKKETVLQAGKIIHDQAELLDREYQDKAELLRIRTVGGDKVTTDVVEAWNDRLVFHDDSYGNRIAAYISALKNLSDQLRTSAEQYGLTEEEITATFGPKA
jgi:hypothetical protein